MIVIVAADIIYFVHANIDFIGIIVIEESGDGNDRREVVREWREAAGG
jgi:hypothetical protein